MAARTRRTRIADEDSPLGHRPVTELFRGKQRLQLIRDLAMGEWTVASIAKQYKVDTRDIVEFQDTFAHEISEVSAALAGQLAIDSAGLWISKRQNRLAELQADFEEIEGVIQKMRDDDYYATDNDGSNLGSRRHRFLVKAKIDILKAAAEELSPRNTGQYGAADDPNVVHYVIETGGATEALT
jgi:hypothetical protein